MKDSIILQDLTHEQLSNLIDEKLKNQLDEFKKELEKQQTNRKLIKKRNYTELLKIILHLLHYLMISLQVFHLFE